MVCGYKMNMCLRMIIDKAWPQLWQKVLAGGQLPASLMRDEMLWHRNLTRC